MTMTINVIFDSEEARNAEDARRATVGRYTRAGRNGRVIYCSGCGDARRMYHFAWFAIICLKCDKMRSKYTWLINPPTPEETEEEQV